MGPIWPSPLFIAFPAEDGFVWNWAQDPIAHFYTDRIYKNRLVRNDSFRLLATVIVGDKELPRGAGIE